MSVDILNTSSSKRLGFESYFFLLALFFNLFVAIRWIREPVTDFHSFRQSQTAISAYWIQEDGRWLDLPKYETPLFGYPWRVPFEFPIYQWLIAVAYHATHFSMDALGRGISSLFFYACLGPIFMISEGLGLNRRLFFLAGGLLMLSPMYLYWSRTYMIESTALFFCFLFLASIQKCLATQRFAALWWLVLTLSGLAGILVKVTTFPSFAVAGALLVLMDMVRGGQWKIVRRWLLSYLPIAFSVGVMLVAVQLWVKSSDAIKVINPISAILTSTNLKSWEWGIWPQRISRALWVDAIWDRIIPHTIGMSFVMGLMLIGFIVGQRRCKQAILILLALFMTDLLLFTNLQIIHDYYAYSTSFFLIFALAFSYWGLRLGFLRFYYFATVLTAGLQIAMFCFFYGPYLNMQPTKDPQILSAYFVDSVTPRDSVIFIVGCDWNSVVDYYSQRRAVYFAGWMSTNIIGDIFTHPERYTEGKTVSAIIENTKGYPTSAVFTADLYINPILPHCRVAHFGDYRVVLPPLTAAQQVDNSGLTRLVLNKPLDAHMQGFVDRSHQWMSKTRNQ